jgi:hypothetical protein
VAENCWLAYPAVEDMAKKEALLKWPDRATSVEH